MRDYARASITTTKRQNGGFSGRMILLGVGCVLVIAGLVLNEAPRVQAQAVAVAHQAVSAAENKTSSVVSAQKVVAPISTKAAPVATKTALPLAKPAALAKPTVAQVAAQTPAQPATPEVKFDFYTTLPAMKVAPAPKDTLQKPAAGQFFTQVGIYGDTKYADNMTEVLQLKGFNPQIVTLTSGSGQPLYRVIIGPFSTKQEAAVAQKNLQEAQISSVVKQQS